MSTAGEDVSITATESTVAGSSVAATEAEEDAASYAAPIGDTAERAVLTKEKSVTDINIADDDEDDIDTNEEEEYAAPMHLHALRTPAKLRGARSRSSSRSRSRPGSRRNSASPPRSGGGSGTGKGELLISGAASSPPSASVESSLDGAGNQHSHASTGGDVICDPDILLDKLGFRDLDPDVTQEELQELLRKHVTSNSSLPTLNEVCFIISPHYDLLYTFS